MSESKAELFSKEFRHDTAVKVVKGVADGSIRMNVLHLSGMVENLRNNPRLKVAAEVIGQTDEELIKNILELVQGALKTWTELTVLVRDYCSGEYQGEKLDSIELAVFEDTLILRGYSVFEENYSPSKVEQEIGRINQRIDSTNALLGELLRVTKAVLEVIEGLDK
ncbi:MAG TPA: hypothetical protein VND41_03045 [Nitrososphaerales archaeon]|nr:hypothetical protein [Nitrososphaerales archaeon]